MSDDFKEPKATEIVWPHAAVIAYWEKTYEKIEQDGQKLKELKIDPLSEIITDPVFKKCLDNAQESLDQLIFDILNSK